MEVYKSGAKAGQEYGYELHTQFWIEGLKQDPLRHFRATYWGKHRTTYKDTREETIEIETIDWTCIARRLNGQIIQVSDAELRAFIKGEDM